MFTVKVEGLKELQANLKVKGGNVGALLKPAVYDAGQVFVRLASAKAPHKTGTLAESIDVRDLQSTATGASCVVGPSADVPYAKIQEYGGPIEARNKPYLVFQTDDGAWHSVKKVTIPPHPYMRPAWDEGQTEAKDKLAQTIAEGLGNL